MKIAEFFSIGPAQRLTYQDAAWKVPQKRWMSEFQENPSIWANYNNSPTWNKAIWGWFPLLTMIPVRENSEVVIIYPDQWMMTGIPPWLMNPQSSSIFLRDFPWSQPAIRKKKVLILLERPSGSYIFFEQDK